MSDSYNLVDPTVPDISAEDVSSEKPDGVLDFCVRNISYVIGKNRQLIEEAEVGFDSYIGKKPHVAAQFQNNMLKALQLEADLVKLLLTIREYTRKETKESGEDSKYVDNRKIVINLDSNSRRMLADVISGKFSHK